VRFCICTTFLPRARRTVLLLASLGAVYADVAASCSGGSLGIAAIDLWVGRRMQSWSTNHRKPNDGAIEAIAEALVAMKPG